MIKSFFIGRFQPFHNGHFEVCKKALDETDHLVILVGGANLAPSPKNPWSFKEREEYILDCLQEYKGRVTIWPIDDENEDSTWLKRASSLLLSDMDNPGARKIYGHKKDASSYYLESLKQVCGSEFHLVEVENVKNINATYLRQCLFDRENPFFDWTDTNKEVPEEMYSFLKGYMAKKEVQRMTLEWQAICDYKESWKRSPFPPVFVTVDNVVTNNNHLLLIRRENCPGKGLLALPGGFLDQNETIAEGALRELKEETNIDQNVKPFYLNPDNCKVFDHPGRSQRGRTITHAFRIDLPSSKNLPAVKAADDAAECFWLPIEEIAEHKLEFFEDHYKIIEEFLREETK